MGHLGQRFIEAGLVENNLKLDADSWPCHTAVMKLEVVCLIGLVGTALAQVRWGQAGQGGGGHVGQGGGGGFNPGSEFPALGQQPSSSPGIQCRNETTGVFGPCTGKNLFV